MQERILSSVCFEGPLVFSQWVTPSEFEMGSLGKLLQEEQLDAALQPGNWLSEKISKLPHKEY